LGGHKCHPKQFFDVIALIINDYAQIFFIPLGPRPVDAPRRSCNLPLDSRVKPFECVSIRGESDETQQGVKPIGRRPRHGPRLQGASP
jgi:hypothetical protein